MLVSLKGAPFTSSPHFDSLALAQYKLRRESNASLMVASNGDWMPAFVGMTRVRAFRQKLG